MLDEPASGLSHGEVEELADLILALRDDFDLTVLLVEHHMGMVMRISDQVVVLDFGQEDRRGRARRGPGGPGGDRGLPGGAGVSLLEVEGLEAGYGPVTVVRGVSFSVDEGQVVAILGANGAGKTTTLRALSGMVDTAGSVSFDGAEHRRQGARGDRAPRDRPRARGARQLRQSLTVEENLRLGAYVRRDGDDVADDIGRCLEWFPRLEERGGQAAGSLSGGEQQMLAVARGLMLRPRLLLLDEPSLGLAPIITREVFKVLREIGEEQGTTLLVVEQNANLVLEFADYAYVLEAGRIVLDGDADQIAGDDAVHRSYLGMV